MASVSNVVPLQNGKPENLSVFRQALQAASCPILIIQPASGTQNIVHVNSAFEYLSGYSAPDVLGRDWACLFSQKPGDCAPEQLRSMIQQGRAIHVTLPLRRKDRSSVWTEVQVSPIHNEVGKVTHHIAVLRDLTEERESRAELEHHAYHDSLTGLPNRRFLHERLKRALARSRRSGKSFTVVLLDMNGFKLINDSFGHDTGDELLKCVAKRLRECVREEDTVARLGGDEFVLLLENGEREVTEAVMPRVARSLGKPMSLKGHRILASCCMGVAHYPMNGQDMDALLKAADLDLYRAKGRVPATRRRLQPSGLQRTPRICSEVRQSV